MLGCWPNVGRRWPAAARIQHLANIVLTARTPRELTRRACARRRCGAALRLRLWGGARRLGLVSSGTASCSAAPPSSSAQVVAPAPPPSAPAVVSGAAVASCPGGAAATASSSSSVAGCVVPSCGAGESADPTPSGIGRSAACGTLLYPDTAGSHSDARRARGGAEHERVLGRSACRVGLHGMITVFA